MSERRRLRIAYVAGLTIGGAERQQLALAEHLPRDRFAVEFIVLGERSANARAAEALGVPVHVLGSARRATSPLPVFALRAAGRVAAYLRTVRRGHYDIVDAWLYHAYALAALTRPVSGAPILIAGRRSLSAYKRRFGPLERILDGLARRSADVIVANSAAVVEDVVAREGIARSRLRLIRNGVVPAPELSAERRAELRAGWGVAPDALVIGCIANPRPGKGLELLVRIMGDLRAEGRAVHLVVIGEGPLRPTLEAQIAAAGLERVVILPGAVPDARPLYGAFDVVVQASEAEGLPNALLEAAAAGRAIVATAAGGTSEIVEDGRTGSLVPVGDEPALRLALARMLDEPDLRARTGDAAREHVLTTFGLERMVAETAALYEELARARGLVR
jgi:glycosyltransferase involved in cell wall biosynthesis